MAEKENATLGFILLGFSDFDYNHSALFSMVLVVYALTWVGNLLLLTSIRLSPQLHKPMYVFLGNLSAVDICFSTVTVPRLLLGVLYGASSISFLECFLQMFFFVFIGVTEVFLLVVMAFDRFLAICNPLRYTTIMNKQVMAMLISSCWAAASLDASLHTHTLSHLLYCENRLIRHFFCDVTPVLKLACSSTARAELQIYTVGLMTSFFPLFSILTSYVLIAQAIMKLKTTTSRSKAFSSCSSHLTVVCVFYGTIIVNYFRPSSNYSSRYDRLLSLGYTILTPVLNPFIYSLRNQDVKQTLKNVVRSFLLIKEQPAQIFIISTMIAGQASKRK